MYIYIYIYIYEYKNEGLHRRRIQKIYRGSPLHNHQSTDSHIIDEESTQGWRFSSVHPLSRVQLFATPWNAACQASLSITNSQNLLKFMSSRQWRLLTILYSVVPFSSCLQSFPPSGSFPMSHFFLSGGQSIGTSASTSVLPMNTQNWFPLEFL